MSTALGTQSQPKYDFTKLQREELNRGVVAIRQSETETCLTWRYLSTDPLETAFNVYRDGQRVATVPAGKATMWVDKQAGGKAALYEVRPVVNGAETHNADGKYALMANAPVGYLNIPLQKPEDGKTPSGQTYSYSANDASIGDVDGDGEYEIILKWDPSNAHDNAHDGYTGNVLFDCYRLTGERLWRIDLGRNIRAGAHYTQFMVYDLDGDNRAEVVMKTGDGTVDGTGKVIGNADADWREMGDTVGQYKRMQEYEKMMKEREERMRTEGRRPDDQRPPMMDGQRPQMRPDGQRPPQGGDPRNNQQQRRRFRSFTPAMQGRILKGPEYLTVFSGLTGEALCTIDYVPERGDLAGWGDTKANRSDRYLACVAYLDGVHPSVVMCRGYYTRTVLAAFDWDGKQLKQRWVFDSNDKGNKRYAGQGNHNLRVGDVDGDGCDEIIYGSMAVDHNGKGLYTTRMGHGDAMHLMGFFPDSEKLQVWDCHENRRDGSTFRDAATGKVIFQVKSGEDVGRCMAADIDPTSWGVEMWSLATGGIRNVKGELINENPGRLACNMAVWWDGDLLRELLDGTRISKYNWETRQCEELVTLEGVRNNGSKSNPCLHADILGDWREEVLLRTEDNSALRLYVTTIPTDYRFHTFLEDPVYRISIATQNVAYNQPTQQGFYFGADLKEGLFRGYEIKK
ncbi:MAG: rhamnogalacturonan lyase [Bacteroidaceae bacterium]|nr:rhamnogalacturonan lyase [Bacteroidaceae bacterium]